MAYTKVGPFVDGGPPYLSAMDLNTLEAGIAAGAAGPTRIAAEQNGVTATGTDVSAAFTALLAGISSYTVIVLPTGTVNLGTASFTADVSLVSFVGDRTTLTGTGALTLFSSTGYSTRQKNWGTAISGVIFSGLGLTIGSTTYNTNGMFRIVNGGAIGSAITFGSNAWKVAFEHFHVQGGTITSPSTVVNTGEAMIFRDCMLTDGLLISVAGGDWHFVGCSLDNARLQVTNGGIVAWTDGHFEANGGESARLISISGGGSTVFLTNSILVLDAGSGNWTMSPFLVSSEVQRGGLIVNGLQVPLQPYFKPETTDGARLLVAGGGNSTFENVTTYDATINAYALSETANLLRNGTAEEGNSNGWTVANTGTYTADTGTKNRGSYSHKLACTSGQTLSFAQTVTVRPGKNLWLSAWLNVTVAGGGNLGAEIIFFDRNNSQMSIYGYTQYTTTGATFYSQVAKVPPGAVSAQIYFYLQGGSSGTTTAYLDDIVANIA